MRRRFLSMLMCVAMVLTLLPTTIIAAEPSTLKVNIVKTDVVDIKPGDKDVKFNVVVEENPGFMMASLDVIFSDILTLKSIETGTFKGPFTPNADKKTAVWENIAMEDCTDTGVLMTLVFDVNGAAKAGDEVSISVCPADNDEYNVLTVESEPVALSVTQYKASISGGVTPPAHTCTLTKVPAKAATCTEDGNIEYYQCSDTTCGKLYKDAAGTQEITLADTVIKAAGHTDLKKTEAKKATCEETGNEAYWFCNGCNKYYTDNDNTVGEETTLEALTIKATGHDWEVIKGADGSNTHTLKCKVCNKNVDEVHAGDDVNKKTWSANDDYHWHEFACGTRMDLAEHKWGLTGQKFATCTEEGKDIYYCNICQHEKTVIVPKTDHTPETEWTTDGNDHWHECADCGAVVGEKVAHTFNTNDCATAATCTVCGYVKKAGQHTWNDGVVTKEATCTVPGEKTFTCDVCHATKTEPIKASGHSLTKVEAVAATCTEGGNNEYYTCSVCKKVFKADKTTETTVADETLAALGHKLTKTEAKAATCTEAGNNEYYTCGNCGKFFSDEAGKTEIAKDSWVTDALDHDFTGAWVNTDAAGHYHKCSRCDATDTVVKHAFNGKPCNEEDKCTVCGYVKAAGVHAWGTAEYKWGDDNMSCTATVKCTNCEAVETDVAFIGISTTPATCTVDGKTVYTATFSSELFTTQTKEVTIDKLGHTYGAPVWSWSEDGKTATATFTCTREGCTAETTGHAQTVTATVGGKQNVAPTCTDKGTTTYTAKVTFEKKDYTDTKDVQDIKALGHTLTKTAAKAATCTESGNKEYYTCGTCGKFFSDKDGKNEIAKDSWVIKALGHDLTETPAVTPTCAAGGNNEYWTCSVCHKVFKADKTTETTVAAETLAKDPTNHTGGTEQRGAVAASCMTAGRTADTYCKGCGKLTKAGDLIPPTGNHNYVDGVCTTCGSKQPADNATIEAAIKKVVADVKEAVEEVLDKAIKNETDANTKKILEKLKGYVSGSSRSKLQAVYNVTMSLNGQDLGKGDSLADGQNVTIAISEETYNALRSGAKIVESYLDKDGNAQTREINATLKQVGGGYTVTFASDKTAVYGLMTKTSSGSSSGSGSSYTSGQSFTTDLPADSINRVTVNGKKLDSKYYTVSSNGSGSIVTLTDAYLATLKAGKYTVKIENKTHVSTGTFTIKADGTLSSPKTADAGIALYAMLAVSSLMGTAVVSKKRRKA